MATHMAYFMYLALIITAYSVFGNELKIGVYYVTNFDVEKVYDVEAFSAIVDVIMRYDICVIQGIIDPTSQVIEFLRVHMQRHNRNIHVIHRLGDQQAGRELQVIMYKKPPLAIESCINWSGGNFYIKPLFCGFRRPLESGEVARFGIIAMAGSLSEESNTLILSLIERIFEHYGESYPLGVVGALNMDLQSNSLNLMTSPLIMQRNDVELLNEGETSVVTTQNWNVLAIAVGTMRPSVVPYSVRVLKNIHGMPASEVARHISEDYPVEFTLDSSKLSSGTANPGAIGYSPCPDVSQGSSDDVNVYESIQGAQLKAPLPMKPMRYPSVNYYSPIVPHDSPSVKPKKNRKSAFYPPRNAPPQVQPIDLSSSSKSMSRQVLQMLREGYGRNRGGQWSEELPINHPESSQAAYAGDTLPTHSLRGSSGSQSKHKMKPKKEDHIDRHERAQGGSSERLNFLKEYKISESPMYVPDFGQDTSFTSLRNLKKKEISLIQSYDPLQEAENSVRTLSAKIDKDILVMDNTRPLSNSDIDIERLSDTMKRISTDPGEQNIVTQTDYSLPQCPRLDQPGPSGIAYQIETPIDVERLSDPMSISSTTSGD